jgi:predicted dehydrogenase
MNLRFHGAVGELRRAVTAGALGPVRLAEVTFGYDLRKWRPQSDYRDSYSARAELGGGIVLDAIHEIDYLLWILGPARSVTGEAAHISPLEIDVEDVAVAALRFASGAIASVSLNYFEPVYRRGATIVGDDAVASWTWGDPSVRIEGPDGPAHRIAVDDDLAQTYRAVITDFTKAVEGGGAPMTSLAEGLAAVRVVAALKRSARDGTRIEITDG